MQNNVSVQDLFEALQERLKLTWIAGKSGAGDKLRRSEGQMKGVLPKLAQEYVRRIRQALR